MRVNLDDGLAKNDRIRMRGWKGELEKEEREKVSEKTEWENRVRLFQPRISMNSMHFICKAFSAASVRMPQTKCIGLGNDSGRGSSHGPFLQSACNILLIKNKLFNEIILRRISGISEWIMRIQSVNAVINSIHQKSNKKIKILQKSFL